MDLPGAVGSSRGWGKGVDGVSDRPLLASLSKLTKAKAEVVRSGEGPQAAAATSSLVPLPLALLEKPCALGQTVTCCGGMSHTTTKSLVFQREPGTVSVLVPQALR